MIVIFGPVETGIKRFISERNAHSHAFLFQDESSLLLAGR